MKYVLTYILLFITLIGCSSNISREEPADKQERKTSVTVDKDKAMEHFIDGTMAEQKGKFAEAILEFQDALKYDPQPGIKFALAKNYYRLGKFSLAYKYANSAVKEDSSNVEFNTLLAQLYQTANKPDSSAIVFKRIIEIDSTNRSAYYNLGMMYENEKPIQALEVYNKLLKITGPEWNVLVKIADLNERLGNVEETIETVEELAALDPANLDLQKLLIESYIKTERFNEALSLTDEALEIFPNDYNLIELKANALLLSGKAKESLQEYFQFIENDSIPLESKIRIGVRFLSESDKDSVILASTKKIFNTLDQDTTNWQIKMYLGEISLLEKNDSAAVLHFQEAAELASWNVELWMRLGGLLFDTGRFEKAAEEMTKAVGNFPDEFALNFILGLSLAQEDDHKHAEQYLEKATTLNPNDIFALSAYAFTLNRLKKQDEALKALKKALKIDPNDLQVLTIMGSIYDARKDWKKVDETYKRALRIDSSNPLALNNYAYSLASRGEKLNEALEMVNEALEIDPENPSYLDTKGWIYFKKKEYEKAKKYIEMANELDQDNAEIMEHLGDIYFKLDNKDKAITFWKKASSLIDDNSEIKIKIEKGLL